MAIPEVAGGDRALLVAALVCFLVAVPPLPIRWNLVALGLALATVALVF
jgi:hypothetical protein